MNPDELLAQIADLLQQYMGLGPDTPVAQEAGQLLAAIEATGAGGGGEAAMGMGGPPPPPADMGGGMPPDMMGGMPPPDEGLMLDDGSDSPDGDPEPIPRRGGSPGNEGFDKARSGAKEFLKKKKSKAA